MVKVAVFVYVPIVNYSTRHSSMQTVAVPVPVIPA
jgi:hypothetical protein